jgi:integrase
VDRRAAQAAIATLRRSLRLWARRQTVAEYLGRWLRDVAAHRVRPVTFKGYSQLVSGHAVPAIGHVPIAKLTGQHLATLYADRLAAGKSPRTVEQLHSVLHSAFRQAVRWDLIPRNPADLVSPPRPRRPEIHLLTSEQARALLTAAAGDELEALYVLALTTGMRQGELLGLTWAAVDLSDGWLEVRASLDRRTKVGWTLTEPKTSRSRRRIRLAPAAAASLRIAPGATGRGTAPRRRRLAGP